MSAPADAPLAARLVLAAGRWASSKHRADSTCGCVSCVASLLALEAAARRGRTFKFEARPGRDAEAVTCPCGGHADRVTPTVGELENNGCDRDATLYKDDPARACCARAFACRVCGARLVGRAEAPDAG